MQPYFFPYLGYYKLLAYVDKFVIFDNAQFPRRGRVHRFQATVGDSKQWCTLPLIKAKVTANISEISMNMTECETFLRSLEKFSLVWNLVCKDNKLKATIWNFQSSLIEYLFLQLKFIHDFAGLKTKIYFASEILERGDLGYQEYIIEIGKRLGTNQYINLAGGVSLYSELDFHQKNFEIKFLPRYVGSGNTILENFSLLKSGI